MEHVITQTATGVYRHSPARDMAAEFAKVARQRRGRLSVRLPDVLPIVRSYTYTNPSRPVYHWADDSLLSRYARHIDQQLTTGQPVTVSLFRDGRPQTRQANAALQARYGDRVAWRWVDSADWGY